MKYPIATGDEVHFQHPDGYELVHMTPDTFIDTAPPLGPNYGTDVAEDDEMILAYVAHIKWGMPLDAPELGMYPDHDGRHRAHAAKIAGVTRLPVYVISELIPHLETL